MSACGKTRGVSGGHLRKRFNPAATFFNMSNEFIPRVSLVLLSRAASSFLTRYKRSVLVGQTRAGIKNEAGAKI